MTESNHDLTLYRELDAPLERVWQAWTDPAQIKLWWGPNGVTNPTCEWQPKPGGKINIVMLAGPELGPMAGQEWPMTGEFQAVEPSKKLVFKSSALSRGKPILENLVTVSFESNGGKTRLTIQVEVTKITPEAAAALQGMEQGWSQQLDKLKSYVKE